MGTLVFYLGYGVKGAGESADLWRALPAKGRGRKALLPQSSGEHKTPNVHQNMVWPHIQIQTR